MPNTTVRVMGVRVAVATLAELTVTVTGPSGVSTLLSTTQMSPARPRLAPKRFRRAFGLKGASSRRCDVGWLWVR